MSTAMVQASSRPSTPSVKARIPVAIPPSPGNWRHPKLDEIVRRQNAATFGDRNLRNVVWNASVLLAAFAFGPTLITNLDRLGAALEVALYPHLVLWLIRLVLMINIGLATSPLYRRPDEVSDIPLTPSQRKLLGLDPTYTPPAAPDTQYVTPPRYRRSSGSMNPTPSSRVSSYSSSPLSDNGSPSMRKIAGGSPYSPSPRNTPLFQRALGGSPRDASRRHSYGSPMARTHTTNEGDRLRMPATPSPIGNKGASVGVNYKWLYEKSRPIPRSESIL